MKNFKAIICMIDACVFNLSQMYGLRNRIVHDYEGVNLRLVWEVMTLNLENLREELLNINE